MCTSQSIIEGVHCGVPTSVLNLTHSLECINTTIRILLYSIKFNPVQYMDISIPVLHSPALSPYHHSRFTNGHVFQRRVHYHCSHNMTSHSLTVYTSEGEGLTSVACQQPYSNLASTGGRNNNHKGVILSWMKHGVDRLSIL